ncbi:MAG: alpha/beta fold hydrolase, partial [Cyanobacteria bacterium J06649_4]
MPFTFSRYRSRLLGFASGLCLAVTLPFLSAFPAVAAERVVLTYGFVEISTTVDELKRYAETGEAGPELRPYLRFLSESQRSQLRQALQVRKDIDAVQMSQFLYSAIGENILRSVGGIIQTTGRRDGAKALRGALVLAASEPEGLSLLGVLEHFAPDAVRIDSQRAFRVFNAFTGLISDTDNAIAAIENQKTPTSRLSPTVPALQSLSAPGPYSVMLETLSVVDNQRDRTLPTDLYLPEGLPADVTSPVIVISHGLSGDRKGFIPLAEHLASHGYAVAALDHPASNRTQLDALFRGAAQEVAEPTEFSNRPRDVSYLLDALTLRSQANQLNLDSVAVIGHSFGGYTALALSGAQLDQENLQTNCDSDDFIYNAANPSMVLQCTALLAPEQFSYDLRDERIDAVI